MVILCLPFVRDRTTLLVQNNVIKLSYKSSPSHQLSYNNNNNNNNNNSVVVVVVFLEFISTESGYL